MTFTVGGFVVIPAWKFVFVFTLPKEVVLGSCFPIINNDKVDALKDINLVDFRKLESKMKSSHIQSIETVLVSYYFRIP